MLSTGLVVLFWICVFSIALKVVIKLIVPRRIRRSFAKLNKFTLNLVCNQIESYSTVAYKRFSERVKEEDESIDESDSETLDTETIKYNKAASGNKVKASENVVYANFKSSRK